MLPKREKIFFGQNTLCDFFSVVNICYIHNQQQQQTICKWPCLFCILFVVVYHDAEKKILMKLVKQTENHTTRVKKNKGGKIIE